MPEEKDVLSPKQQRSAERLDAIVSAAETLIAERGASGLSMRALGRASGTPQGSLYQYVPSTQAILRKLAERYAARIETALAGALARHAEQNAWTPDTLVDAVLPDLTESYASMPAYHELRLALARDPVALALEDRLDRTIVDLLSPAVERLRGAALLHDPDRAVRVLIEIGDALLSRDGRTGQLSEIVDDARRAMIGYLRMIVVDSEPET